MKRVHNADIEAITQQVQKMADQGLINASDKEQFIQKYAESSETPAGICADDNTSLANSPFKDQLNASVAELEQLLGCKVPIGPYEDSGLKWLEEFSKEAQKVQSESTDMPQEQKCAIEELLRLGFSNEAAKAMVRSKHLSLPLSETVTRNAMLLRNYVDIGAFSADEPDPYSVASFLRHAPEKNLFMAEVPHRYPFSEEEKHSYFSAPLGWTIDYDLRDQLGEALFELLGDTERVEQLLCKMYCSGHFLQPSEKIREDIAALLSLSPAPKELCKLVETDWVFLFTVYKDTSKTISILSDIFRREYIWMIFCKECVWLTGVVRDSGKKYFDQLPSSLVSLKERYSQYMKTETGVINGEEDTDEKY